MISTQNITDKLYILVILDSFTEKKTQSHYSQLLKWKPYFQDLQIPIYILVPNTPDEVYNHNLYFHFLFDPDLSFCSQINTYKNKNVFGKTYKIIYPEINIYYEYKNIFKVKRINKNTLCKAYFECLEIRFKNFKKNFKNFVDNDFNL